MAIFNIPKFLLQTQKDSHSEEQKQCLFVLSPFKAGTKWLFCSIISIPKFLFQTQKDSHSRKTKTMFVCLFE